MNKLIGLILCLSLTACTFDNSDEEWTTRASTWCREQKLGRCTVEYVRDGVGIVQPEGQTRTFSLRCGEKLCTVDSIPGPPKEDTTYIYMPTYQTTGK